MRWEVPTMVSKRSCFNLTLMRRDLLRFWPCWAATLLVALLLLPVNMASGFSERYGFYPEISDSSSYVCNCSLVVLLAAAGLGIIVAVLVSRHLFTSRAVNFYHALPIRREGLLLTNAATGLVMLWVPILITALVTMAVELSFGVFEPVSLGQLLLLYLCSSLFFFALGMFCCHVTGMAAAAIGLYVAVNCGFYVAWAVVSALMSYFVVGYVSGDVGVTIRFLTPLFNLILCCGADTTGQLVRLNGMGLALLYAAVGAALLGVVLLLYRSRRSERAGDLLAFGWLRPVFKVACALVGGMALSVLTVEMYYLREFGFGVAILLVVAWSLVAWFVAEMLVRKSIRVFCKKAFLQWGITAFCAVLFLLGIALDVFGVERRVPEVSEIQSAQITINGRYAQLEHPEKILELHKKMVENRELLRTAKNDDDISCTGVRFEYILTDGISSLERYYCVPTVQNQSEMIGLQQELYDFLTDPDVVMEFLFDGPLERKSELKSTAFEYYDQEADVNYSLDLTSDEAWSLYQAIGADIYAGNINWVEGFCREEYAPKNYDEGCDARLEFNYLHWEDEQAQMQSENGSGTVRTVGYQWVSFQIDLGMTHTLAALEELGWRPEMTRIG